MEANFSNNTQARRFELELDGKVAYIDYRLEGKTLTLLHTEVPKELSGKGVGSKLVSGTLQYISDNNLKLIPSCSFVEGYIEKHAEWKDLISER